MHKTKVKDYRKFLAKVLKGIDVEGLPIPKNLLIEFLSSEVEKVFEYIVTDFELFPQPPSEYYVDYESNLENVEKISEILKNYIK